MVDQEVGNLNVKISMDQTGFQNGISSINTQLKVVQSSFKAASTQLGGFGNSTDQLKLKADSLNQQIELQKQKVDALTASFKQSVETKGADAMATQNLQIKLNLAKAALSNMGNELQKTNSEIDKQSSTWTRLGKSFDDVSKKLKPIGEGFTDVGKKLSTSVTAPVVGAGVAAVTMATSFEDGMAKISTVADTSKTSLKTLGDGIVNLSDQTGQATNDIQEGLYDAISAGVDTAESMDFMTTAVKAAKGGFTDTKTSVDGLTTTLNAYGLETKKATDIANQMMVAQNLGKTTFGEMADSMGNVVPTAASLGVKTNELFSSLASLTANGIKTSEAVTGLKAAFSNVVKPSSDAAKTAGQLGIQFNAVHLQSVGWGQFLEEIKQKTNGSTEVMAQLFGSVEALNTVLTLTSDNGMGLFQQSMQQMASGTNYVDDAFNKVTHTSGQRFKNSLNELKNSGIKLGESLTPIVDKISGVFKSLATTLNSMTPAQQQMLIMFAGIAAAIGPILVGIGSLITAVSTITGAFSAASVAIAEAGGIIALITSPIGIAIGVIALLAGAAFLIIKNWEPIKTFFQDLWTGIVLLTSVAWNGIKTFFENLWVNIKTTASTAWEDFKNWMMDFWNSMIQGVEDIWNGLINWFKALPENLYNIAVNMFTAMKNGVSNSITSVKDSIVDGITTAMDWIKALPDQAFEWGVDMIQGFINGIRNMINNIARTVSNVADTIRSYLHFSTPDEGPLADYESWMPDFMQGLATGIEKNKNLVKNAISNLSSEMKLNINPSLIPAVANMGSGTTAKNSISYASLLHADKIVVSNDMDIQTLANKLEFYRQQAAKARGSR